MSEQREELQLQAEKLKKIRADLGLTRKAFSEYIGIPFRNLEEWEAGRRKMPYLAVLPAFAMHLLCLPGNGLKLLMPLALLVNRGVMRAPTLIRLSLKFILN